MDIPVAVISCADGARLEAAAALAATLAEKPVRGSSSLLGVLRGAGYLLILHGSQCSVAHSTYVYLYYDTLH